ncbi:MAG: NYN domain-containing protein [Spirochaetia bacterium]|nr:NYN domain-containing protein [Spirochaetia bacterium]
MRLTFLVDGFNLYHSIIEVENKTKLRLKWLNIRSLCEAYVPNIDSKAKIEEIYYFSAYAKHRLAKDPDVINRHKIYIEALRSADINIELGHFKSKKINCPKCHNLITRYEEKETDVAIAIKIFELFFHKKADHLILITGDTDLVPAVKSALNIFRKKVSIIFPYNRYNAAFLSLANKTIKIKSNEYLKHQFDNRLNISETRTISKPSSW